MDPSIRLRPAVVEDVPIIVDIYTSYVKNTVSTYAEELPILNEFIAKFYDAQKARLPWIVAVTSAGSTTATASDAALPVTHTPSSVGTTELTDSTLSSSSSSTAADCIVGYAYTSFFRPRSGWRFTVENSIYLRNGYYRKGIGTSMMTELLQQCAKNGFRQMIAVITVDARTGDGLPSVQLHKQLGFTDAGMLKNVGFKFGRWLDCAFLQKDIGEGASTLPV